MRLTGLDDWIRAIRFDPEVGEMAVADGETVKILERGSNNLLREIEPEAGLVTALAYQPHLGELAIGVLPARVPARPYRQSAPRPRH